ILKHLSGSYFKYKGIQTNMQKQIETKHCQPEQIAEFQQKQGQQEQIKAKEAILKGMNQEINENKEKTQQEQKTKLQKQQNLKLTNCLKLKSLYCFDNQLTELKINHLTNLA